MAAGPAGFENSPGAYGQPQGFSLNEVADIATLKRNAYDEQIVTLKGRFTRQLTKDKYEFTDVKGQRLLWNSMTIATGPTFAKMRWWRFLRKSIRTS